MEKNRPKIDNRFVGGFFSDSDIQWQPQDTYRDAVNMRVLFNEDGGLSIENDKGNKSSFSLVEYNGNVLTGYIPIGYAGFSDKVVIFSTDDTNSEIGFVTVNADGIGTYTQVYNDKYDPNGDLLNFSKRFDIEAKAVKETDDIERVYWTDNKQQFSVINIQLGASFNYSPQAPAFIEYPFWYSAHSFQVLCDFDMGDIRYNERIEGTLKTGVYQYAYRQGTRDGYRTPFTPLTRHYIMNSQPFGDDYQMQPSNQVTEYGFKISIFGIDVRFPILEVAYVYSIAEEQTVDAAIFFTQDRESKPPAGAITIEHTTHAGEPVDLSVFNQRLYPLRKVKTLEEKDNILFLGNVKEVGVLEPDLSEAVISPLTRTMKADYKALTNVTAPYAIDEVVDTTVNVKNYTGKATTYEILNEPATYRGTAFEHLFTSYWRGETYRFGVLLYDRKGMPNYVFYLDDYTFPEQYDASGNYTLTVNEGGVLKIRLLGMQVSGIKIPVEVLYDEDNKLNISGFSIVRAKRVEETLFQGVVMNTVYENDDTTVNGVAHWRYTRPVPMTENYFNGFITPVAGSYPNNAIELQGVKATTNKDFASRAGTVLMYSPEIFFGYKALPEWTNNSNIKAVGVASAAGNEEQQPGYNRVFSSQAVCHFYSKNYTTENTWSNTFGSDLGDVSYIEKGAILKTFLSSDFKLEDYDIQRTNLIYTQYSQVDFDNSGSDCTTCNIDKFAWGCPDSMLLILKDFKDVSAGQDDIRNKVLIANFRKPNDGYFSGTDENAIEKTIYISTGHFQPINEAVIADTQDADGNLVFNEVEVWGGDCYPSYFGFTRLLPQYRDCETDGNCFLDYSVSMIVPLESNINYSLRIGRTFAKNGVEPENTSCGSTNVSKKGIQEKQREDFNLNSVLQHEENIQFFNAKPSTIVNRKENPMTIIYSETKYYGEPQDNYRKYLANNYFDLTGANGDVNKLFSQYSYIYFLQTKGFGRLYINQPATLNSPETGNIIVGSSGILTGALYISQDIGCQHQFSVIGGHNQTYWVDVNLGKIYRFSQNGLSPISEKGQHNRIYQACKYFKGKDNPAGFSGITGVYDYKNNEVIFSFHAPNLQREDVPFLVYNFTLVYGENTETFTTRFSEVPHFYFPLQGKYFSSFVDSPQDFYVHLLGNRGEYYGTYRDSTVDIVVNPTQDAQKIYDITQVNINAEGVAILSQVEISTDNQTFSLSLPTDTRARYRYGFLSFPARGLTQTDRTRGKWMKQKYTIVNTGDLCRITMVENKFRIAFPI